MSQVTSFLYVCCNSRAASLWLWLSQVKLHIHLKLELTRQWDPFRTPTVSNVYTSVKNIPQFIAIYVSDIILVFIKSFPIIWICFFICFQEANRTRTLGFLSHSAPVRISSAVTEIPGSHLYVRCRSTGKSAARGVQPYRSPSSPMKYGCTFSSRHLRRRVR